MKNDIESTIKTNQVETIEQLQKRLENECRVALSKALPWEQYGPGIKGNLFDRYCDLLQKDERTIKDLDAIIEFSKKIVEPKITVRTLIEFRTLLKMLGKNEKDIANILEHENAHMNIAEEELKKGIFKNVSYNITMYKTNDGIEFIPTVEPVRNVYADNLDVLLGQLRTTQAPDQYGHAMSDQDISDYNSLIIQIAEYINSLDNDTSKREAIEKIDKYNYLINENITTGGQNRSVNTDLIKHYLE